MISSIYKKFFKKFPYTLQFSGIISLCLLAIYGILYLCNSLIQLSIASLLYSFLGIFSFLFAVFIISILFNLISPLIYSYFASNSVLETNRRNDVNVKNFLKTYLIGNRQPIKGTLSVYNTILKSFLIYIVTAIVLGLIVYYSLIAVNYNGMRDIYNELINIVSMDDIDLANEALNEFASSGKVDILAYPMYYINFAALLFSLYYFVNRINVYTFKYYLNNAIYGANPRLISLIFKNGLKRCRKDFYKDYYKNLFSLTLIYVLVFCLSYFLLGLVPKLNEDLYVLNITTLLIVLIFLLPFMPISFNLYAEIYPKYANTFIETFVNFAKSEINTMRTNYENFSAAQQEALRKNEESLKKFEEYLDKNKEVNKEDEIKPSEDKDASDTKEDNDKKE